MAVHGFHLLCSFFDYTKDSFFLNTEAYSEWQCFKYFKATVKIKQLLLCLVDKSPKHGKNRNMLL